MGNERFFKGNKVTLKYGLWSDVVHGTVIAILGRDYIGTMIPFNAPSEDETVLVQWDGGCAVWENPTELK